MCNISLEIDDKTKEKSEKIFDEIGLSFSTAVNVFLKACIKNDRMPIELGNNDIFSSIIL